MTDHAIANASRPLSLEERRREYRVLEQILKKHPLQTLIGRRVWFPRGYGTFKRLEQGKFLVEMDLTHHAMSAWPSEIHFLDVPGFRNLANLH